MLFTSVTPGAYDEGSYTRRVQYPLGAARSATQEVNNGHPISCGRLPIRHYIMSVRAMSWAFEQSLPPVLKVLLLALADHAGEHDECWPSVRTLVAKTSMSERTVRTHLRSLADRGFMTIEMRARPNGSQTSNVYRLAIDPPANPAGGPGKLLHPQEPSSEQDLTKTSSRPSRPIGPSVVTDSRLSPVEKAIAGRAGLASMVPIQQVISIHAGREVSISAALTVAQWILAKAKTYPTAPGRYVMAAVRRDPLEVQQYIDEAALT